MKKISQENKQQWLIMLILSGLMGCTTLSTDIYLPAMPAMEKALGGNVEFTITGFLIGFAIAQLIWGPISDRIGRKKPLYAGMAIFTIGSIGCAMSDSITEIVIWRVFQATGACIGPMLSRSMVRDLYNRTEAARMLSALMTILALAPIIAPLAGGFLQDIWSWRAIFWLMTALSAMLFVAVFFLPETLPKEKRANDSIKREFMCYLRLVKNKPYMAYTLSVASFYVAIYAFIAGSPFVYISYFHVDAKYYGLLFGMNMIGVSSIGLFNRKMVTLYSLDKLLLFSTSTAIIGGIGLFLSASTGWGGIFGIIGFVFIIFSMNGIIASCTNAAALDAVPATMVGSAAAFMGALQYGSGIISSLLLASFSTGTPFTMSWIMLLFVALSFVAIILNVKNKITTVITKTIIAK